jgi:uncharacterized protein (TIGR00369 family)
MADFDIAEAERLLASGFPTWVQELDITFDKVEGGTVVLRIPPADKLKRHGGMICGQAIMALADTAMAFAVASSVGKVPEMTTVSQTSSFLRAAMEGDLVAEARVIKRGRKIVYGEVNLHVGDPDKPVAHVTSVNMLL